MSNSGCSATSCSKKPFFTFREAFLTAALAGVADTGHVVGTLVHAFQNALFQLFVLVVLGVVAGGRVGGAAHGGGQILLQLALGLNGFVAKGNGGHHFFLAHFLHGTFHHGHRVGGSAHHQVHVGAGQVGSLGVNLELPVDARHAHFGNRAGKRDVGNRQGGRGGQRGQRVGLHFFIGRDEGNHHLHLVVVVFGEHRPQDAVDEAANQDFVVAQAAFAALKRARNLAGRAEFLLVVHRQRQKIDTVALARGRHHRGEQHGVAEAHHNGAVGEFGQLAGFDGDDAAVGQRQGFGNGVGLGHQRDLLGKATAGEQPKTSAASGPRYSNVNSTTVRR